MAKKPMKTPGAPAASRTRRSPLAPTDQSPQPSGLPFDDASSRIMKGQLRQRAGAGVGASDAAIGAKGRVTPRQTSAGAQYRITTGLPAPQSPEARATQANGRIVPAVMGSKQRANFDAQQGVLY